MIYEVGKIYENAIGKNDGIVFDIEDDGASIIAYMNRPTEQEKDAFKSGKPLEVRFIHLGSVLMMTFKFNSLNWMDAPYTPHLSRNLTKLQLPDNNQGLGTTVALFDTHTGRLESLRYFSFSEQFTRKLFGEVMEMKIEPFDKSKYIQDMNSIFNKYTTKELVKLAGSGFKI